MPTARSTKYPNLYARGANVRFKGGLAEVTAAQAKKLSELSPRLGVEVDAPKKAPAKKSAGTKADDGTDS